MRSRAAPWLAWALAGLSFAMFAASVVLYALIRSVQEPGGLGAGRTVLDLLVSVPVLAFPFVGALIVSSRPGNLIGWICLVDGLLWTLLGLIDYYSVYGLDEPGSVPFPAAVAGLSLWLWVPTLGLLVIYLALLFPDGRLPSRRWRPVAVFSGAVIASFSVTEGLNPQAELELGGVRNPFGLEGQPWISDATNALTVLFLLCILASILSLILRYRRSQGEERQQIKWIAFAASFAGSGFVIAMVMALTSFVLAPETRGGTETDPLWFQLLFSVVLMSFGGVPIAVGFAVLRHRLYDVDLIINRTLVYGVLTITLVLVYFGSVMVLQRTFVLLTGEGSQLTIVASTLAIAALFNPLRRRVQAVVDRLFYRRKYDAAKTLEAFSAKLRDETNLGALNGELLAVVRETVQPEHASVWLRAPEREYKDTGARP
jgi:hypothetical protein